MCLKLLLFAVFILQKQHICKKKKTKKPLSRELPLTFLTELMQQLFIRGVFIYPPCLWESLYSMGMEF